MLADQPIIAFLATARAAESVAFYRDVLGLELIEDSPFALVMDSGGRMVRIQKVDRVDPAAHTALGWQVADIGTEVRGLAAKGVTFEHYPHFEQDADGIWTSPNGAKVAWFRDPDGNVLSLTQFPG